jgi:hypothetical protein
MSLRVIGREVCLRAKGLLRLSKDLGPKRCLNIERKDELKEVKDFMKMEEKCVMDRLQTSGELQDKTSFIDPSTGVDLLKGCSPDYLFL